MDAKNIFLLVNILNTLLGYIKSIPVNRFWMNWNEVTKFRLVAFFFFVILLFCFYLVIYCCAAFIVSDVISSLTVGGGADTSGYSVWVCKCFSHIHGLVQCVCVFKSYWLAKSTSCGFCWWPQSGMWVLFFTWLVSFISCCFDILQCKLWG